MPGVSQFLRGAVSGAEAPGNNGDLRLAAGYYCRGFARLAARTDVADSRKSSRQVEFERPTDCGCCLLRGVECQKQRSTLDVSELAKCCCLNADWESNLVFGFSQGVMT